LRGEHRIAPGQSVEPLTEVDKGMIQKKKKQQKGPEKPKRRDPAKRKLQRL